jgi:O-antigen/teichoic acid export membrane protein
MAHNFTQQVVFRALGMIASVLTVSATTRYLGPSSYGALTTAVMFVALWTSLTELGIGQVVVRRVMSGKGELERLIRVNVGMSTMYCLPLFALTAISGALIYGSDSDIVEMVMIVAGGLILTTMTSCFGPIFLVTVRFGAVALSDLLSRVGSLGATLVLIHFGAGTVWFAVVMLVPPSIVLLIQGVAAARITNWRPVFALGESWELLREGLPLTAMLIVGVLYWRVDGVILSLLGTTEQVGVYGLAYTLTFTLTALSAFFLSSTLSAMVHTFAQNRDEFIRFTARSVESMLFAGAPIAVVGAILANQIVELVGSDEFVSHGGPTVALLSVAVALTFLTGVLSQALFAAHDQSFLVRLSLVNLILNIVLNIVLVPFYGAVGSGLALVATEVSGLVFASWRLSRLVPYRTPWVFLLRLLVPLAACAASAESMRDLPVLLTLGVTVVVYLLVNLAVGPANAKVIKTLFSKRTDSDALDRDPATSLAGDPEPEIRQAT